MTKSHVPTMILLLSAVCGCAVDAGDGDVAGGEVGVGDDDTVTPADELPAQSDEDHRTLAATRYVIGDGKCHTNGYLKDWANSYCKQISSWKWSAYDFNFTNYCTGWWGGGHKNLWFSCAHLTPI